MQKIEFLVWTGRQYALMSHDWLLDSVNINSATVQVFLKPIPKPEPIPEKKPEGK